MQCRHLGPETHIGEARMPWTADFRPTLSEADRLRQGRDDRFEVLQTFNLSADGAQRDS